MIEPRISYLAYASEIASAIVAARQKIVEGAVGMVEMALADLKLKNIIEFDNEKKR